MDFRISDIRILIKYLCKKNMTNTEIYDDLRATLGETAVKRTFVFQWAKRFKDGRSSVQDDPRPGRPVVANQKAIEKVEELISEDRRITYDDIKEKTGLCIGTITKIIHTKLEMRKVSARWVPHHLTHTHMTARKEICTDLLQQYARGGRRFISRIVTCDETWVHHYDPETKQQSMEWRHKDEPSPRKFKREKTVRKVMCIFFWDVEGPIVSHMVPAGQTVTARYYSNVLETVVTPALREKRRDLNINRMMFLHDNASSHTAKITKATMRSLGWNVLNHPAYSPDLAPSDFYLFPAMKKHLKGRSFSTRAAIASAIHQWFIRLPTDWFKEGMMKLPGRWEKCIQAEGDFFEK